MDVSHNFRFRWNDHVPHLSQIFSELRFEEVYCDTTLISDDGFVLKAHGAVLSATSLYFERVLSDVTTDQHPIIVLKGANFTELSCLLDYIYEGVTQVDQHLMESVLDVADMLEIKGLSKMKNNLSIKKLIAPSPPSSVVSRSSPQCSSPSKSPSPPSHTPHIHSPSCPSSPNDSYAPSALLKMDADDPNELSDASQKKKNLFHDSKMPIGARLLDSKEYTTDTSKHSVCTNSDYLDQTLGIDLSLSRSTNDEGDRASVKNFNLYDDTPLRKRKIMKFQEFTPPLSDLEWGKLGEKVDDSVPHKKKKFFTRSDYDGEDDDDDDDYDSPFQNQRESLSGCFPCEENPSQKRCQAFYCNETGKNWQQSREDNRGTNHPQEFQRSTEGECSNIEDCFRFHSYYYGEIDDTFNRDLDIPLNSATNCANTVRCIKQNPYSFAAQICREKSVVDGQSRSSKDRRNGSVPQLGSSLSKVESSGDRNESDSCTIWSSPGIVQIKKENSNERSSLERTCTKTSEMSHSVYPNNDVTHFVSVKVRQPEPGQSVATKPQDVTHDAFRAIDTRIRRPTTQIKRPLSKYNLFMKKTYPLVSEQNPEKRSAEIIKIVSSMWKNMSDEEKHPWEEKANELHREFKIRNPDYVFCPKQLQNIKHEYDRKRAERRNMFKINSYIPRTHT